MLLLLVPLATGCLRVRASITISPDDLVSGEIVAAAKPKTAKDAGPQLDTNNLPFSQKVAVSNYSSDGYVGSQAVFSNLTFAELPQLANMNSDSTGVNVSLRRNGNLVILEGRADLTSVTDPDADVELTVAFPGVVTSTNGDRVEPEVVSWKLKPGVVSTMTAQARYTDPNTRSFTAAAVWLGIVSFAAAGVVALLAWLNRDRSPRLTAPRDQHPS
ncbi:LppM family (lipo)protein [Mycobacterium sp.]|uniref:LppM family (lipo)protein n=1 Tax=Mycobacterium sp. TaxID=1785 RepID=UPI003C71DA96